MPTYRYTGTHVFGYRRQSATEETRYSQDGTPYIVRHPAPGPDEVIKTGELFGPSPEEISAFGDLMEWVSDEPFNPPQSPASAPASAPATRLNPELYAIIKRANTGTATADEQQVSGDILDYMEKHAQGTATPEDTAALELVLTDFGLPLFVV